jgi:two-component system cell cycle sensor histidine kinase/response regulator CckA
MNSSRFEQLLRAIAPIQWQTRPDGYCTEAASWAAYTGRTEEEELGAGWLEMVHPDDRERSAEIWARATATGSMYRSEYRILGRDGRYRWFDVYGTPLKSESGEVEGWYGVCIDIHDRVEAQDQLRQVVDNMSEAFITIDRDWTITFQNQEGARINGKAPHEVLGRHMWDEWPEVPGSALEEAYRKAWATGEPVRFEHRYYDPGKYDIWLEIQAVPTEEGSLGIFYLDITERKKAERRVQESERRFRQLADHSRAAFLLTSPDGERVDYASPYIARLTGHGAEAVRDRPGLLKEAVHPDDRARVEGEVWRAPTGEAISEYRVTGADGEVRRVSHRRTAVPATADNPEVRVAHIVTDVTEQREIERQLQQAQRMESLGQLAGGVAHDFNNILTVVLGRASLLYLRLEEELGRTDWPELADIEAAAFQGANITRQILSFSRDKLGEPVLVNVNEAVQRSSRLIMGLVGEGVDVSAVLHDDLPPVNIDPVQLDQVLMNLATNAGEAMGGRGTLAIETDAVVVGDDSAGPGLRPGRYVRIRVQDSGPGIPEEMRERIFEPFFSTRSDSGGTGLGLATCFGVANRAGGAIVAANHAGGGAEFSVYLPAAAGEVVGSDTDTSSLPPSGGSETLLIAEDQLRLGQLLADVLTAAGYTVHLATDGAEALRILREVGPVDLLVTDMVMPGMSGRQLAREALAIQPDLPVLTVSGYRAGEEVATSRTPAELAFLAKPFGPAELALRIRAILDAVAK